MKKAKSTKAKASINPSMRTGTPLPVYFDVSIKVSDKSFAERIQRAIQQKCGFNAEILTQAR